MKPPPYDTHSHDDPDADDDDLPLGPSKTQRKRESHELQALGETIVGLPKARLDKLALPEPLLDAVMLARKITAHEGRRRQMQYIGKLMRRVDADAIRAVLVVDDDRHRAETAIMHAAERWRDALIAEPGRLTEFVGKYPLAALRNLHPMIRSAATEVSRAQHGRHYRELFRELRDIMSAELDAGAGGGGDAADESDE